MTETLTMTRAARRWAGHLPADRQTPEAGELDLWTAIFAGAGADEFTGLILGPPAGGQTSPGEVTTGQQVFELDRGQVTGRYVTQQTERGHLTWVAMGPGTMIGGATVPAGTYTSLPAAKQGCRKRSARPLEWTEHPDGISRAGSARHGHWIIFASVAEA